MNEAMIVEAIQAAKPATDVAMQAPNAPQAVANPSAVSRFQAAMGIDGPQDVDPIPFASEATAAWRSAQVNNQGILHRIRALSEMSASSLSGPEMIELQYEVANLAFQQEVITKVADKSSNAIQTLIKNQ
jgi:hypothetical protein